MSDETKSQIESMIKDHRVFLFMKGNKLMPQCGFSGASVQCLNDIGADFETFNVLESDEIRQGIKTFANWPTIPQLYVDQKFVGGCDIIRDMHSSGELKTLIFGDA